MINIITGDNAPLWKTFGWTTVTYLFYIPGSALGAFSSDWIGPKNTLALGVGLQGIIGFIMSGCYKYLATSENVAAFVVVYGYVEFSSYPLALNDPSSPKIVSFLLWVNSDLGIILVSVRPRPVQPLFVASIIHMQQHLERLEPLWEPTSSQSSNRMPPTRFDLAKIHSSFQVLSAFSVPHWRSFSFRKLTK